MLTDIKSVKLLYYKHRDIAIQLPTHYNKHSKIFNSYKYDISGMVLKFIEYKVFNGELKFIVDDTYTEIDFLRELETYEKDQKKKLYTKVSGLIVKQDKRFYTEFLHSSISTMEDLLRLNVKLGLEFNILKIFVDEIIVDKPLLIKNVRNEYGYNFNETYFRLFVKSLPFLKKQLYITDTKIDINHNFTEEENLITDLEKILDCGISTDMIHIMTTNILAGTYDASKLIQFNETTQHKFIRSSDKVEIPVEFIKNLSSFNYDVEYYYNIYRDIASNLVYLKELR